jgi:hypothetical protein
MTNIKFKLISKFFKLKSTLKQELGKDVSRRVVDKTEHYYKELDNSKPKAKGVMKIHRTMWVLGLALYRAMQDEPGGRDDLVDIVLKVMWLSVLGDVIRMQAFFVHRSRDPFNLFLKLLGPRNERFFTCPPWEKVEVEIENGVGWDQLQCPIYEFFKEENEVGLTRAYCDLDEHIAELVPNHVELRRERTLAKGDCSCDFYYYKKLPSDKRIDCLYAFTITLLVT